MASVVAALVLMVVLSASHVGVPAKSAVSAQQISTSSQPVPVRAVCLPCDRSAPVIRDLTVVDPLAANPSPGPCDE